MLALAVMAAIRGFAAQIPTARQSAALTLLSVPKVAMVAPQVTEAPAARPLLASDRRRILVVPAAALAQGRRALAAVVALEGRAVAAVMVVVATK